MIQAVDQLANFVSISVSTLLPDRCAGFRLYLQDSEHSPPRLYCAEDVRFEQHHLEKLQRRGRHTIYIGAGDHELYQQYLRDNLTTILSDESVTVRERFSTLNLVVRDVLAEAFRESAQTPQVARMRELASVSVDLLLRDDFVVRDVLGVLHHDYQTFTHSANVSFYCVMLAKAVGINGASTLREIALGGFLHDLGKLQIPEQILNKPDRLTPEEMEIVREHPHAGFVRLAHRDDLSRAQLMMVYQHHERIDGGGYPVGCSRNELHDWARLCTVVDIYEALDSDRPYRNRLPHKDVMRIMNRDAGKKLDEEFLKCWKSIIAPNSAGC